MSYRVNASSCAGAVSVPVASLERAWANAEALASAGHKNIVIIDAGTGMPVRRQPTLFMEGRAGMQHSNKCPDRACAREI